MHATTCHLSTGISSRYTLTLSCLALPCLVLCYLSLSSLIVLSRCLALSCSASSFLALSCPVSLFFLIVFFYCLTLSCLNLSSLIIFSHCFLSLYGTGGWQLGDVRVRQILHIWGIHSGGRTRREQTEWSHQVGRRGKGRGKERIEERREGKRRAGESTNALYPMHTSLCRDMMCG